MANNTDTTTSVVKLVINGEGAKTSVKELGSALGVVNKQLREMKEADNPAEYAKAIAQKKALTAEYIRQKGAIAAVTKEAKDFKKEAATISIGVLGGNLLQQGLASAWQSVKGFVMDAKTAFQGYDKSAAGLQSATLMSDEVLNKLKKSARELKSEMGYTAQDYLEAATKIGSAKSELTGSAEAMDLMVQKSMLFAQAGKLELPEAGEALSIMLNQFSEDADEAGHFVDVMAQGFALGAAELPQIIDGMKYAGVTAKAFNVTFGETNAVLQLFVKNGLTGEMAGTQLRSIILALGTGADDTNPSIVGLETALENLRKKNLSATEQLKLFGKENMAGGKILLNNLPTLNEWIKKIEEKGTAEKMAAINMNTLEKSEKSFEITTNKLAVAVGEKLAGAFSWLYDKGSKVIEALTEIVEDSDDVIDVFISMFTIVGNLLISLRDLTLTLTGYSESAKLAGDVTKGIGVVLKLAASAFMVVINEVSTLIGYFDVLINSGKKVMNFFGGQFKINPNSNMDNLMNRRQQGIDKVNSWWSEPAPPEKDWWSGISKGNYSGVGNWWEGISTGSYSGETPVSDPEKDKAGGGKGNGTGSEKGKGKKKKPVSKDLSFETWQEAIDAEIKAQQDLDDQLVKMRKEREEQRQKERDFDLSELHDWYEAQRIEADMSHAQGLTNDATHHQQRYDLEQRYLAAQIVIKKGFGDQTLQEENKLTELLIEETTRRNDAIKESNERTFEEMSATLLRQQEMIEQAQHGLTDAMIGGGIALAGAIRGLTKESSGLYKTLLVVEKALAIADIIVQSQREQAGYYRQAATSPYFNNPWTPPGVGLVWAAAMSTQAKIRTGISVGLIGAQTIAEVAREEGGLTYESDRRTAAGFVNRPTRFNLGGISTVMGEKYKPEFVISNQALQLEPVAQFARMIDSVQKSGNWSALNNFGGSSSQPQMMVDNSGVVMAISGLRRDIQEMGKRPINFNIDRFEDFQDFLLKIEKDTSA